MNSRLSGKTESWSSQMTINNSLPATTGNIFKSDSPDTADQMDSTLAMTGPRRAAHSRHRRVAICVHIVEGVQDSGTEGRVLQIYSLCLIHPVSCCRKHLILICTAFRHFDGSIRMRDRFRIMAATAATCLYCGAMLVRMDRITWHIFQKSDDKTVIACVTCMHIEPYDTEKIP